jgi:hypothetical protein
VSKIRTLTNGGQVFWCPGCDSAHALNSRPNGPRWSYNENPDSPTFSPSVLVTLRWSQNDDTMKDEICHSFVKGGRIQFLGDCTHKLVNQTVDIPEWPHAPGSYGGIEDGT